MMVHERLSVCLKDLRMVDVETVEAKKVAGKLVDFERIFTVHI